MLTTTTDTFSVDIGAYRVTGTLGTKTKSVDVFCDVVGEYQVEIDYKLWLYKSGEEISRFKIFNSNGSASATMQYAGDHIVFRGTQSSDAFRNKALYVVDDDLEAPIDLSKYSKLCVDLISDVSTSSNSTNMTALIISRTYIGPAFRDQFGDATWHRVLVLRNYNHSNESTMTARTTFEIDLTGISGTQYFFAYLSMYQSGSWTEIDIYNAWLE